MPNAVQFHRVLRAALGKVNRAYSAWKRWSNGFRRSDSRVRETCGGCVFAMH